MENKNNDTLLKDFLSNGKQEIADNGFTKRMMRKLPDQPNRSWIVWTFACIGMTLTLAFSLYSGSMQMLLNYLQNIPIYYLLGVIFCFPLVGMLSICLTNDKKRWVI